MPSFEKADWAGELGPFDPTLAILARVFPRSRPDVPQLPLLNMVGPNGELVPGMPENGLRCGMEPARSLERREAELDGPEGSVNPGEGELLKGL